MPVGVYVNDGSGRDSYVNGACLTNSAKRKGPKEDFWPTAAQVRRNHRLEGVSLSLSSTTLNSTLTSPVRSDAIGLSPQSARSGQLPQLSPQYASPTRAPDAFAQRGNVTPRSARVAATTRPAMMESESMYAARTGRYALAHHAPPQTGRLPGLKLHQQIGVLDEV